MSFRLPKAVRDKLAALSKVRRQPQWRLIVESLESYLRDLPKGDRARIARMLSSKRSHDAE